MANKADSSAYGFSTVM